MKTGFLENKLVHWLSFPILKFTPQNYQLLLSCCKFIHLFKCIAQPAPMNSGQPAELKNIKNSLKYWIGFVLQIWEEEYSEKQNKGSDFKKML